MLLQPAATVGLNDLARGDELTGVELDGAVGGLAKHDLSIRTLNM